MRRDMRMPGLDGSAAQRRPRCPMTDADAPATVLVVDDDEAKRYILTSWLRRAGHTVIEAATGREALDTVGAVELVLLDVNLPDMTGYEVCRARRARRAAAGRPYRDRSRHRPRGAGHGWRRRARPARREPARHDRLRSLPADQGQPADGGGSGGPGLGDRDGRAQARAAGLRH